MPAFFCVVLFCVGRDLVIGRSPIQGVQPKRLKGFTVSGTGQRAQSVTRTTADRWPAFTLGNLFLAVCPVADLTDDNHQVKRESKSIVAPLPKHQAMKPQSAEAKFHPLYLSAVDGADCKLQVQN
jgi:hypothetical protein